MKLFLTKIKQSFKNNDIEIEYLILNDIKIRLFFFTDFSLSQYI